MFRRALAFAAAMLLLLGVVAVLPASAAEDISWATLNYTCVSPFSASPETGLIRNGIQLAGSTVITAGSEGVVLMLDGVAQAGNTVTLEKAGRYNLKIAKEGKLTEAYDYEVVILPAVNVYEGQIFTSYPTIVCENVEGMVLNKGKDGWIRDFQSGSTVTHLGAQTLEFQGTNCTFSMTFAVMVCTVERGYDEALGLEGMTIRVGEFEGQTLDVRFDGATVLAPGSVTFVTAVGQHTLDVQMNGEKIANLSALPNSADLNLKIDITLPNQTIKQPSVLRFSAWDANVYVNGKLVEEDYRVEKSGEHVIEVRDASGNLVPDAFCVRTSADDAGVVSSRVTIVFDNPHDLYAVLLALPALALVGVAVYFSVRRKQIV